MIIFYAFTTTQLINMYNIRSNIKQMGDAVLYIELGSRIPRLVVERIIESKKFGKVIIIGKYEDEYKIVPKTNIFFKYSKVIKKIYMQLKSISFLSNPVSYVGERVGAFVAFIRYVRNTHFFYNYLKNCDEINCSNEIFIGTCGNLSSLIIKTILKRVKKLVVNLVDEGTANYSRSKEEMCLEYKNNKNLYSKLLCKYYHFDKKFFNSLLEITENNYLLQPSAYVYPNQYVLKKIPPVTSDNPDVQSLLKSSISQSDVDMYKHKHVYYMLQEPGDKFEKCLSIILKQINHSELLLKEHPWYRIMDSLSNVYDLESVLIDKRTDAFIFEALCTHYSFDDRVIITNFSSSAFMPKFMFGSEPSVIFLYNLILDDDKKIIEFDYLVDALKKLYSNPTKIYVPKTFDELSSVVIEINKVIM